MTTLTMRTAHESDVMDLLRQGIPLTLLMDLADPFGPHSSELYDSEGTAA